MLSNIIQIGNSKGIRIPKELLKHAHLEKTIEIIPVKEGLLIKPTNQHREGWEIAFAAFDHKEDDFTFVNSKKLSSWDDEEWEW
jgi:antitoxin MazE